MLVRSLSGRRAVALALVLALLPVLGAQAPASAATPPKSIARALARSPVFVDPAFDGTVTAAQRTSLVRAVRAASRPVYVAFHPLEAGDEYDGDAHTFLAVLHDHLARDGIYLTVREGQLLHRGYGETYREDLTANAAISVITGAGPRDETPVARVRRFLGALADPDIIERANPQPDRATPASESGDDGAIGTTAISWRSSARRCSP